VGGPTEEAVKRRNFSLALTALVVGLVALVQKDLRQVGSRFLHSLVAWRQTRARLNETQRRIEAANEDLRAIVQAELGHIEKQGKFATLHELVSSGELGPEMAGRHGYVYGILLERNCINASAYPAPGEQLPALYRSVSGPGLVPLLTRLQQSR